MGRRRRNPSADGGGGSSSSSGGFGSGGGMSWADEALSASAAAVSFVLLLTGSLLAQPCLSAPTTPKLDPRPWHHPCGANSKETGVPAPRAAHPRHLAIKALKRVRTQMRLVSGHYEMKKEGLAVLHQELKQFKDLAITYAWLPEKQYAWFESAAKCKERHPRLSLILPQLHTALQIYLVTFEEINRFPHSQNEPQEAAKHRKKMLFDISKELKKWLCEVETALISSNIQVPLRTKEEIIPRDDLDRWHSNPSHTTSLLQTWGVLTAYRRFTQEWQKIFKEAMETKLPATCSGKSPSKAPKTPKEGGKTAVAKTPATAGKKPAAGAKKPTAGGKNSAAKSRKPKQSKKN